MIKKYFLILFFIALGILSGEMVQAAAVVTPSRAFPGQQVTINYGTSDCGKQGVQGYVTVDGVPAQIVYWYTCLGEIKIIIPIDATRSNIEVHTIQGFVVTPAFQLLPNPQIHSITPAEVVPGETKMVVNGSNLGDTFFDESLYIEFTNGKALEITSVYNWSDSRIEFPVPDTALPGTVILRRGDNIAGYSDYVRSPYFYVKPIIADLDMYVGQAGDEVIITGLYFKEYNGVQMPFASDKAYNYNIEVYIGSTTAQITSWEWDEVRFTVPYNAKTGDIKVRMYSPELNLSVESVGPLFTVLQSYTNDPLSAYQTYLETVHIPEAWNYSTGSSEVVVAVVDSGIYLNHEDLIGNIWKNDKEVEGNGVDDDKNGYIDDYRGWNFIDGNHLMDLATDKDDHGTMVSGIIGAKTNNGLGISGINRNIKLMPLIITDGYSFVNFEAVSKAIRYAVDNGADIINLSFGTKGVTSYTTKLDEAIKYAYSKNVLIVAAAGNGDIEANVGVNLSEYKQSPVCNDNDENMVLGVGALTTDGYRAGWSNYGSCVDVWAPGENVVTTSKPTISNFNNFYYISDGTSFSAPIVSGIAALIKAKYPEITNKALRDRLIQSVKGGYVVNAYEAIKNPLQTWEMSNVSSNIITPENSGQTNTNLSLIARVKGYILLQVQSLGEAWYVHPETNKRYYMKDGNIAYQMMRSFGLGITDSDLGKIPVSTDTNTLKNATSVCLTNSTASRLKGKILLQVEQHGEAWYVYPKNCRRIYMKDGTAAYEIMRFLGLGITNADLNQIPSGSI